MQYSVAPSAYTSAAGPTAAPLTPGLLRRHVAGRAHDLPRARQPAVALDSLRQPEVGHPRVTLLIKQDVARLQVAVNHAALMGIFDGLGDFDHQLCSFARGSGPSFSRCERLWPSTNPIEK